MKSHRIWRGKQHDSSLPQKSHSAIVVFQWFYRVRSLARTRRLSSSRMLVELIENGIEAEKRKQKEFFELAERFRNATDSEEAKRLGDKLGRMVFSG